MTKQPPSADDPGGEVLRLAERLNHYVERKQYGEAARLAKELWGRFRDAGLTPQQRSALLLPLTKAADLFRHVLHDTPLAVRVLKDIAATPEARWAENLRAGYREWAAYQLGLVYHKAGCHHSSTHWFEQALHAVRENEASAAGNVRNRLLLCLVPLADDYTHLGRIPDALRCYREIVAALPEGPLAPPDLYALIQPGMNEARHGDLRQGLALLGRFRRDYPRATVEELASHTQERLAEGLLRLERGELDEAAELANDGLALWRQRDAGRGAGKAKGVGGLAGRVRRALSSGGRKEGAGAEQQLREAQARQLQGLLHGLLAKVLIAKGRDREAVREIAHVHDVRSAATNVSFGPHYLTENVALLGDLARAQGRLRAYDPAFAAYYLLATYYGHQIGHFRLAPTAALRLDWLARQTEVVHEMVSFWLSLPDPAAKARWEAKVASSLLQLKANLFTALCCHRRGRFKGFANLDKLLFQDNRAYAAAARRVLAGDGSPAAWSDVEDAFLRREHLEAQLVASPFDFTPGMIEEFSFDFSDLGKPPPAGPGHLSFFVVDYRPPGPGAAGGGQLLLGVMGVGGPLRVVNLGEYAAVERAVGDFLQEVGRPPADAGECQTAWRLGRRLYDLLLAPFEPLPRLLGISPDGALAGVPFHALVRGDRYLAEDHHIAICHSPLHNRTMQGMQRHEYYPCADVLLIGGPDYGGTSWPSLEGTAAEVRAIAELLGGTTERRVHLRLGADATPGALEAVERPRVVHIAAHGHFIPGPTRLTRTRPPNQELWPGNEITACPLTGLDACLLRSNLVLSRGGEGPSEDGRLLSALELSSLDLLGCHLVALSACSTGAGVTTTGTGTLGFQFAILASMARAGLVALWEIPDDPTTHFMTRLYELWADTGDLAVAYERVLAAFCRSGGAPVHPYYWAGFLFLDQER